MYIIYIYVPLLILIPLCVGLFLSLCIAEVVLPRVQLRIVVGLITDASLDVVIYPFLGCITKLEQLKSWRETLPSQIMIWCQVHLVTGLPGDLGLIESHCRGSTLISKGRSKLSGGKCVQISPQKVLVGRKNIWRFANQGWGNQGIGFVS